MEQATSDFWNVHANWIATLATTEYTVRQEALLFPYSNVLRDLDHV